MRFRWGYFEILGGIIVLLGTFAILPNCPYFLVFAYGPCNISTTLAKSGIVLATSGAIMILVDEFERRMKPSPKPFIA